MAKALHKVQKQISKKRGGKPTSLHENSRDSQRLRRAVAREDKLAKLFAAATRANHTYVERVAFFQSAIQGSSGLLSEEEMRAIIATFIARSNGELASLKAQRRPGRPSSRREDLIKHRIEAEDNEYNSGFWLPDMSDEECRSLLERWNGEWASMNTLKFVRIAKLGGTRLSSFPPKGVS